MPRVVKGKTDLWTTAPHVANLLLHPEHGYCLSLESRKKDDFICPYCGTIIENKIVASVSRYGLRCPVCSDGVSYPEKFIANLLRQLDVKYIHDNSFEWSNGKRYDFYIKDLSLIIETHGIQHYSNEKTFHNRNDSLIKEKTNDIYKKEIAIKNGITNYIELDCRYSDFEYIKNSVINSDICNFLNLSLIDWNKLSVDCLKSNIREVCDLWNSGIKSIKEISERLNIRIGTVADYLKRCAEYGLCDYVADRRKHIICVDTGKIYANLDEVSKDGFNKSQVSECCNHSSRAKTAGGYNWCFLDEYNPDTYVMKESKYVAIPKKVLWIEANKVYDKLTDCKNDGFNPTNVSQVCNGKQIKHKGQHFKFV